MKILLDHEQCPNCGKLAYRDFNGSGKWYECEECGNYFSIEDTKRYLGNFEQDTGGRVDVYEDDDGLLTI